MEHDDPVRLAAELQALYADQLAEPHFAALLADLSARNAPLIPIYDDHDFLGNDRCGGDAPPALREAARAVFVDTFAPLMTGQDVYRLQRVGPADIIVLDERFYRTRPAVSRDRRDAILGTEQWNWFEGAFTTSTAAYVLIASSSTFHKWKTEAWARLPATWKNFRATSQVR